MLLQWALYWINRSRPAADWQLTKYKCSYTGYCTVWTVVQKCSVTVREPQLMLYNKHFRYTRTAFDAVQSAVTRYHCCIEGSLQSSLTSQGPQYLLFLCAVEPHMNWAKYITRAAKLRLNYVNYSSTASYDTLWTENNEVRAQLKCVRTTIFTVSGFKFY